MSIRALFVVATALATTAFGVACSLRDTEYLKAGTTTPPNDAGGSTDAGDAGTDKVVVANQLGPRLLVQDDTTLYWVTNDGTLRAWKKDGSEMPRDVTAVGAATTLAAQPGAGPSLFYTADRKLFRVAKTGGSPAEILAVPGPTVAIAIDETYVFVANDFEDGSVSGAIRRVLHDGGSPAILHESSTGIFYALALQGDHAFWDEGEGNVSSLPKTAAQGTAPTEYSIGMDVAVYSPAALAVEPQAIFYSDDIGEVRAVNRMNPQAPSLLIARDREIHAIALDDRFVYGVEQGANGTLLRNTKDGLGSPEPVAASLPTASSLVVDATSIYVAVEGPPGAILKFPK